MAALLIVGEPDVLVCLVTLDSTGAISSASSGVGRPSPLVGSIDVSTGLTIPASVSFPGVTVLGGRVTPSASAVHVLVGSMSVTASVGSGFYVAWWPSDQTATEVLALDSAGRVIGSAAGS